jgi:hypothetical protein
MKTFLFPIFFFCFSFYTAQAQNASPDSLLVGIWKGTSICQVKNSPCHDEVVVYHISKAPGIDTFDISANKIVNSKEEEMGTITCKFNRTNSQLISTSYNSLWTFNLKGRNLEGTLLYHGSLFRIIHVSKQP